MPTAEMQDQSEQDARLDQMFRESDQMKSLYVAARVFCLRFEATRDFHPSPEADMAYQESVAGLTLEASQVYERVWQKL